MEWDMSHGNPSTDALHPDSSGEAASIAIHTHQVYRLRPNNPTHDLQFTCGSGSYANNHRMNNYQAIPSLPVERGFH
jgi:hypothetical protein